MICCYEMRKGRGSCVEPSSLKNFGSMFDAEAIHAQIPSNIEPNYQRTWCNGHKTGHASFLSSYIANLPLVSPMFVLGLVEMPAGPLVHSTRSWHVTAFFIRRENFWPFQFFSQCPHRRKDNPHTRQDFAGSSYHESSW